MRPRPAGGTLRPAWAESFDVARTEPTAPLSLPDPLLPEWAFGTAGGAGVTVAVVDSGVESGHPLVGRVDGGVAVAHDASSDLVSVREGLHEDLFGHGTACAGIVRRLAPRCRLLSVRVLGGRLTGRTVCVAAGVRWAIDAGADVVNLSLSTGNPEYFGILHELADEAYFARTLLVCAANNMPGPTYPSQFASVISVAAAEGARSELSLRYNPRPPVEFGARGMDVEVAWSGGRTVVSTGNSYAAAHVSGMCALILGAHPGLTPFQVKTVLHGLAAHPGADAEGEEDLARRASPKPPPADR